MSFLSPVTDVCLHCPALSKKGKMEINGFEGIFILNNIVTKRIS